MKLAHLRSFFTSMDGKSTVLFLRQFQGIYEEKPMGLFPGLLEPTLHFQKAISILQGAMSSAFCL